MLPPLANRVVARVLSPPFACRLCQGAQVGIAHRDHHQETVLRPDRRVDHGFDRILQLRVLHLDVEQVVHHPFEGHVDAVTKSGLLAPIEGRRDRTETMRRRQDITGRTAVSERPVDDPGIFEDRHIIARMRVHDRREGRPGRVRTGRTIARDCAVDQSGIDLGKRLVSKAQAFHHTRTEILQHHVGLRDQAAHRRLSLIRFEVENDAFLTGVELREVAALAVDHRMSAADGLTTRRLDLNHLCTMVREQPPRIGSRQEH